jgi:DNA-binding transcriptional MerR regulator
MAQSGNGGDYFKEWYGENADELNKKRRDRYANDPEYRKKIQDSNARTRKVRRKKRQEEKKAREKAKLTNVDKRPWRSVTATVEVDGEQVEAQVFTIGALAKALGCSVQVIRLWESKGIIPETPLRGSGGDRLYTAEFIEMVAEVLEQKGRLGRLSRSLPKGSKRKVAFNGEVVEVVMFRVGALADAIGRTAATIDQLEQRGVFPKTPFRASSTRYRLYTAEMIETAKLAFESKRDPIRGEVWEEVRVAVEEGWEKLGVFGARLEE